MKIKICLLSIIFFSLISTQVVAETTLNATQKYKFLSEQYLSQAKKAYNKNDYDNALMLFQKSAALNNAIADFLLGTLYYAPKPGTPITRNYDLAIAHMTRSAQLVFDFFKRRADIIAQAAKPCGGFFFLLFDHARVLARRAYF